jgi:HAE1 family hydrophobic/amphiphilic exporter-1
VGQLDCVSGSKQIEFYLLGPDQAELERLAAQVMAKLRKTVKGFVDIESSVKPNKPTIDIAVKREAASDFGMGVEQHCRSIAHLGGWAKYWRMACQQRPNL